MVSQKSSYEERKQNEKEDKSSEQNSTRNYCFYPQTYQNWETLRKIGSG